MTPQRDTIHVISDSQVQAVGDAHETQMLYSPSVLMNTNVAMETLKHIDDVDKGREEEAQ